MNCLSTTSGLINWVSLFKMAAAQGRPKDYTAIEMKGKDSSKLDNTQLSAKRTELEKPFDEDFWNKVKNDQISYYSNLHLMNEV